MDSRVCPHMVPATTMRCLNLDDRCCGGCQYDDRAAKFTASLLTPAVPAGVPAHHLDLGSGLGHSTPTCPAPASCDDQTAQPRSPAKKLPCGEWAMGPWCDPVCGKRIPACTPRTSSVPAGVPSGVRTPSRFTGPGAPFDEPGCSSRAASAALAAPLAQPRPPLVKIAYHLAPSLERCIQCGDGGGALDSRLGGMCGDWAHQACTLKGAERESAVAELQGLLEGVSR